VVNEPRSGSSWLQEISQTHPGVRVQFELGLEHGDDALACRRCARPSVPDSKRADRFPPRSRPPLACGMTVFGSANSPADVAALAARSGAALVVLLRVNHVAHAVSLFRHFNNLARPVAAAWDADAATEPVLVPWGSGELVRAVEASRAAYAHLLRFPAAGRQPAHLVFYEDLKQRPAAVWAALQAFLGLPPPPTPPPAEAGAGGGGGLEMLEQRSSDRPSIRYLERLAELQAELAGEDWGDMLRDPAFDDAVDAAAAFAEACRLHPAADLSWRGAPSCAAAAAGGGAAGGAASAPLG
jgi:hypothetical protein